MRGKELLRVGDVLEVQLHLTVSLLRLNMGRLLKVAKSTTSPTEQRIIHPKTNFRSLSIKQLNLTLPSPSPLNTTQTNRNMLTSLIKHDSITTTTPKAKEIAPMAERLISKAKDNTLHSRRMAMKMVREAGAVTKLFEELGPRYANRTGGYTRVLKLSKHRHGDKADMSVIEFVDRPGEVRVARNNGYGAEDGFNVGRKGFGEAEKTTETFNDGGEGQISNGGAGLDDLLADKK
jgi:large subunit ribosomal protein L17